MKFLVCFVVALFAGRTLSAQDFSAYREQVFFQGGSFLPYHWLLPDAGLSEKHPPVIFLHGAFEKGLIMKDNWT